MKNSVSELQSYFCPFGYSDIEAACEIWDETDLKESELFDLIDDAREDMGYKNWDGFDPVYSVLDHVVQTARNKIEEITGYDFINDFSGSWTEINVHGNFMCSSIDYSNNAIEELVKNITWNIEKLVKDKFCQYLFSQLNICRT